MDPAVFSSVISQAPVVALIVWFMLQSGKNATERDGFWQKFISDLTAKFTEASARRDAEWIKALQDNTAANSRAIQIISAEFHSSMRELSAQVQALLAQSMDTSRGLESLLVHVAAIRSEGVDK